MHGKSEAVAVLFFCVLMMLMSGTVAAQTFAGVVEKVDPIVKTFSMCPVDDACGVTENNIFVVTRNTRMESVRSLQKLDIGDFIEVEGEPLNEVVWKAKVLRRR